MNQTGDKNYDGPRNQKECSKCQHYQEGEHDSGTCEVPRPQWRDRRPAIVFADQDASVCDCYSAVEETT